MNAPRAGQPAQPSDLVDVAALVTAYYTREPDPDERRRAGGVRHLRPPRLEPADVVQRGPHPGHHPGDLRVPARRRASTGRCSSAATPTALSEPAWATALEVLVANDVTVLVDSADRYTPTPAVVARHPDRQPRQDHRRRRDAGAHRSRRRHRRHPVAQPARRRRVQVQPAARRAGRHRRHRWIADRANELIAAGLAGVKRVPFARARAAASPATTSSAPTSTTCPTCSTSTRSAASGCGSAPTRWAARRSTTGARSPSGTGSTSPSSTRSSTPPGGS